jgi:tetratricopeptide (TPR) repeat protein
MTNSRPNLPAIGVLVTLAFALPLLHSSVLADPLEFPKKAAAMAGALAVLLAAALARRQGPNPAPMPRSVLAAGGAMLLCAALATTLSANASLSLRGLARDAALVVIGWAASRCARDLRVAARIMNAVLASATLVAAGTLIQTAIPGFSLSLGGVSILPPVPAGATLGDPGLAVQFLILAVPLGLGAATLAAGPIRLLCGAGLGVVVSAVIFCGRPEGWIAGGLVAACILATRLVRAARTGWGELVPDLAGSACRAAIVGAVVVLLVIAASRIPGLSATGQTVTPLTHVGLLAPTSGEPAADRAAAIHGTVALLTLHPLGVGPGYWRHAFLEVAWTRVPQSPFNLEHQPVHAGNGLLELTAEFGIVGGLLFAALVILLALAAARTAMSEPGARGDLALAALNVLLAAMIVGCLGSPLQETTPALLFWLAAGMCVAASGAEKPGEERGERDRGTGWLPRGAGWMVVALWAAAAVGCAIWLRDIRSAERHTLVGQSLLQAGDIRGAIRALSSRAARRSPDHLPHALLGNALMRAGQYDQAATAFGDTLARSPWFLSAYLGRATAWVELGRYDRADEDLRAALTIWPDNPGTLMRQGQLDARRGRLDQAIADYRRAADRNPTEADPWYALGEIYARRGDYDQAIDAFRRCAEKNPRHPRANIGLGEAFEKKGLYEMAVRFYQRAAGADEKAVEPRLRMANAYHALGQDCEAKDSLEAARDLENDAQRRSVIIGLIDQVDAGCRKTGPHPTP